MCKRVFILALTVIVLNTSGCWDARDVGDLAFPIAAAYDVCKNDKTRNQQEERGEECRVDVTTLDPNLSPGAKSKTRIETLPAVTIAYARNKRGLTNADEYLPGLNQSIIYGEELAKRGLSPYCDSILRVPLIPIYMQLAVAEGRGEDILLTPITHHENLGFYLLTLLHEAQKKGFIPSTPLYRYFIDQAPGKNPVIPMLKRHGNDNVVLNGCAVFNKDKLIKKLDVSDTRTLVMLRGLECQGYLPYQIIRDGQIIDQGTVVVNNSRKVKVSRRQDKYSFNIDIKLGGVLVESTADKKVDDQYLKKIENSISRDMRNDCIRFINQMQNDMKIDCIDINKYALAQWRNELLPVIDRDFIQNANIKVNVKVHIENNGEIL